MIVIICGLEAGRQAGREGATCALLLLPTVISLIKAGASALVLLLASCVTRCVCARLCLCGCDPGQRIPRDNPAPPPHGSRSQRGSLLSAGNVQGHHHHGNRFQSAFQFQFDVDNAWPSRPYSSAASCQ